MISRSRVFLRILLNRLNPKANKYIEHNLKLYHNFIKFIKYLRYQKILVYDKCNIDEQNIGRIEKHYKYSQNII